MAGYTIEEIAGACGGKLHPRKGSLRIRHLVIDSRKYFFPAESVFFAIKGERHDGHHFIREMYNNSVRCFLVSSMPEPLSDFANAYFILVPDTLRALQEITAMHRSRFNIPVIGITGSNGKTILKEWLFQLLHKDKIVVRSPKSYNSQVGVPLSVWQLASRHEIAIFEAGISKPDEMKYLYPVIKPGIGIFTNIGQAHQEHFSDIEHKIKEKLVLFKDCGIMVYCRDHSLIDKHIRRIPGIKNKLLFTWSSKKEADLKITGKTGLNGYTHIEGRYKGQKVGIRIPFTDQASVENSIHAWSVLLLKGYPNKFISEGMERLVPVAMRMEQKKGINNCTVINDSYNSDPGSFEIALDFLSQQTQHAKKTIILSDMFETGRSAGDLNIQLGELLSARRIDRIIGIGGNIGGLREFLSAESKFYKSTGEFIKSFNPGEYSNEAILLKGSRDFRFERISLLLEEKAHATVMEVNLNNLVANYNYFKSQLNPETKVMAVVKAFSYGSGSYEIANTLAYNLIDYLAVAFFDEGVSLRKAGIKLPVLIMNPDPDSFSLMPDNNLEPEIYNFDSLNLFIESLRDRKIESYPVHIKLDTGMHRLGFREKDLASLASILKSSRSIRVRSVFSHLAASDDPVHDEFTREQIGLFRRMSDTILSGLPYPVLRHILNSSGIERFREAQFDMVRLGIGMYGISAFSNRRLANVNTFKSIISQVKDVTAGQTIGYARAHRAGTDLRIAVVPVGYADGLDRRLGNGMGKMLVNGSFASVIGNICMDMCMLDISGIDAKEGDEVVIFGDEISISDIAGLLSTIPYEIFTRISGRVKRVYIKE